MINRASGIGCFASGYRPATNMQFGTTANNAHSNIVIGTNGDVTIYTSKVNHYVDGITFKAVIV